MVATSEVHDVGVADLPCEERHDDFQGEGASVDEVAVEEVGPVGGRVAVETEDVEKIVELAVGVATNGKFDVPRK